jgi:3'(2'), 5'-bisphosphate nucleotidase
MPTITNTLLNDVEKISRDAGEAIRKIYGSEFAVQAKEDNSPLTEADSAAHVIISAALARLTPDIPVLSEEAVEEFAGPDAQQRYWLVDPLDGTKEFIRRNGEFTVNIALIENGKPVLGVVYAPIPDTAWLAAAGQGAFKCDANGRHRIEVRRHEKDSSWRVVGSRSHAGDSLGTLLERLGPHELISMGSSLKFCLVAEGAADLYPRLGPTSLWDTAAAQCVVEQAGGAVVQLDGSPLSYADPRTILNPFFIVLGRDGPDVASLAHAIA